MTVRVPARGETQIAITLDSGTGASHPLRTSAPPHLRTSAPRTLEQGGLPAQVVGAIASTGRVLLVRSGLSLAVRPARGVRLVTKGSTPAETTILPGPVYATTERRSVQRPGERDAGYFRVNTRKY